MNKFIENIDQQIRFNQGKNIFHDDLDMFQFAHETVQAMAHIGELHPDLKQHLIRYTTDKAIEEFCRINQYYAFDSKAKNELREIYTHLYENIQDKALPVDIISKNHYQKLQQWLQKSNPFAEKMYKRADKKVNPVACSEYSPHLQINILQIDIEHIRQPVLDIGCGKKSLLVDYLKTKGIDVYGIDRVTFTASHLITADWLEYDYGNQKWGTVVSNIGFSNHFNHHHLRQDGNYIEYGKAYMNILRSLKVKGSFHYAPDLPFIERYLDGAQFDVQKYEVDASAFHTTVIQRLTNSYSPE